MRVAVSKDTTRREITFEVTEGSAPDLDVTMSWHRKPRVIRPTWGTLVTVDGEVRLITVHGGLVLKSGTASAEVGDKKEWRPDGRGFQAGENISTAPEWVRLIWAEAHLAVYDWLFADREDTEQVQAL